MEKPELISVHPQNILIPYKMLNGLSNVWLEFTKKLVGKRITTAKKQQLKQQLKQQIFRNLVPIFIIEASAHWSREKVICAKMFLYFFQVQ